MGCDWQLVASHLNSSGIAVIHTLRRFYIFMHRTTISHFSCMQSFQTQSRGSTPMGPDFPIKNTCFRRCFPSLQLLFQKLNERFRGTTEGLISAPRKRGVDILRLSSDRSETDPMLIKKGEYTLPGDIIAHALIDHDDQVRGEVRLDHGRMAFLIRMPGKEHRLKIWTKPPQQGAAFKVLHPYFRLLGERIIRTHIHPHPARFSDGE